MHYDLSMTDTVYLMSRFSVDFSCTAFTSNKNFIVHIFCINHLVHFYHYPVPFSVFFFPVHVYVGSLLG